MARHGLNGVTALESVCGNSDSTGRCPLTVGVDHIDFKVNPDVERRFIEKAFRQTAISGLTLHMGFYSAPINLAVRYDIPLVIYEESTTDEFGTEDDSLPSIITQNGISLVSLVLGVRCPSRFDTAG